MLSGPLRSRSAIFVRKGFEVSLSVEISQNLQQIEQSSDLRFLLRNGLKSRGMARKRTKIEENAKKIVW